MRILIIEDDPNKLRQIRMFVEETIEESTVVEARSFRSGLASLKNNQIDIGLLDMSLPTFDPTVSESGGRDRFFAGEDVLMEMKRKGKFIPVIVVTQFDEFGEGQQKLSLSELNKKLLKEFAGIYRGTVYYNAAQSNWRAQLFELIKGTKDD